MPATATKHRKRYATVAVTALIGILLAISAASATFGLTTKADLSDASQPDIVREGSYFSVTDRRAGIAFRYPTAWGELRTEEGYGTVPPGAQPDVNNPSIVFNMALQRRYLLTDGKAGFPFMVAHRTQDLLPFTEGAWDPITLLQATCDDPERCTISTEKSGADLTVMHAMQQASDGTRAFDIHDYQLTRGDAPFGSIIVMDRFAHLAGKPDIAAMLQSEVLDSIRWIAPQITDQ